MNVTCPCVKSHSPRPAYLQKHHILPQSWGGKTEPDNLISICGTCHDAAHYLMNKLVRARKWIPLGDCPRFAERLAIRAVQKYLELHGTFPHILTASHPLQEGEHHADAGVGMEAEGGSAEGGFHAAREQAPA